MGEIAIKVNIADRIYPLKVVVEEEEVIRRAAKLINDRIREFSENYSVKDKQDLLSMCALQYATQALKAEKKVNAEGREINAQLEELNAFLGDYLAQE